ncbi:MAG: hypothetical protein E6J91_19950 [Deltaproteobacteria bacterium]|nr:MAG: hypothetical protein E6J91_19950 [Deltaproteobacteria bacterium]
MQRKRGGAVVRIYERWDCERIVSRIRDIHRDGGKLAHSQAPSRLVGAALVYFGSWRLAIESAGLDYKSIRLSNNHGKRAERILAMLRRAAASGRAGLGANGFITNSQAERARQRFGTVRAAILAAGLDADALGFPPRVRYNTDDAIIRELRRLMREFPNMRMAEFGARNVAEALKRRHGSLQAGLGALGIEGWPRQRNFPLPSREEVVAAIQERRRRADSMNVASAMASERRLVKAAYKWFGTWRAAMRAAGLHAETRDVDWDRARVRAELNGRSLRGEPVDERAIRQDDPALWRGIVDRYGGFADALRDMHRARRRSALRDGAPKRGPGRLR